MDRASRWAKLPGYVGRPSQHEEFLSSKSLSNQYSVMIHPLMNREVHTASNPGPPRYVSTVWRRSEKSVTDVIDIGEVCLEMSIKASADAHVLLSHSGDRKAFELVIGGWHNTRSEIRLGAGDRGTVLATIIHSKPPLSDSDWLAVELRFRSGEGGTNIFAKIGEECLQAVHKGKKVPFISKVMVGTGFWAEGDWKVCVCYFDDRARDFIVDSNGVSENDSPLKTLETPKKPRLSLAKATPLSSALKRRKVINIDCEQFD